MSSRSDLPIGTATFLFIDVEGSTMLLPKTPQEPGQHTHTPKNCRNHYRAPDFSASKT
jgi:hypothetical protein